MDFVSNAIFVDYDHSVCSYRFGSYMFPSDTL